MAGMSDEALMARRLLNHQSVGVLCTHSVDVQGYPFGSITPFILNYDLEPTMLISDIAQHTRNIKRNNKVSLTVFDQCAVDPQASGRLTWIGDAELINSTDTEIRHRYLRYFPSSESYFETHDFSLYRIRLRERVSLVDLDRSTGSSPMRCLSRILSVKRREGS